jgi:hypothetical protein
MPGLSTVPIPIRRDPTKAADEMKSQKRPLARSRVFITNYLHTVGVAKDKPLF